MIFKIIVILGLNKKYTLIFKGSGALSGNMLLVRIIENDKIKIHAYFKSDSVK